MSTKTEITVDFSAKTIVHSAYRSSTTESYHSTLFSDGSAVTVAYVRPNGDRTVPSVEVGRTQHTFGDEATKTLIDSYLKETGAQRFLPTTWFVQKESFQEKVETPRHKIFFDLMSKAQQRSMERVMKFWTDMCISDYAAEVCVYQMPGGKLSVSVRVDRTDCEFGSPRHALCSDGAHYFIGKLGRIQVMDSYAVCGSKERRENDKRLKAQLVGGYTTKG